MAIKGSSFILLHEKTLKRWTFKINGLRTLYFCHFLAGRLWRNAQSILWCIQGKMSLKIWRSSFKRKIIPCRLLFLETWPQTLQFHASPQSVDLCLRFCLQGKQTHMATFGNATPKRGVKNIKPLRLVEQQPERKQIKGLKNKFILFLMNHHTNPCGKQYDVIICPVINLRNVWRTLFSDIWVLLKRDNLDYPKNTSLTLAKISFLKSTESFHYINP